MYLIAFSFATNRYLRSYFDDLSIKSISFYLSAYCPHVILPCLRLSCDFHQQFPTSGDLLIKHFFNFQLRSSQSRGIITWRITCYFSIHAEYPFGQSSPFIFLLGWPFYNLRGYLICLSYFWFYNTGSIYLVCWQKVLLYRTYII